MNAPVNMCGEERRNSCGVERTKRYRHQTLDTSTRQIRLIKLRRGQSEQPQCDISVFDLDSAPSFLALSYTWGPPSPQLDILINGESFSIRENLFQFLQAYLTITDENFPCPPPNGGFNHWEPEGDAYFWIDQICIDQFNLPERNSQVGMMGLIYTECYGTIIWLGNIRGCPDAPLLLGDSTAQDYRHAAKALDFPEAISSVSGHEYFTRLWIVQEVFLANDRKILCSHPTAGPVWMNWDELWIEAQRYPQHISSKSAECLLDHHSQTGRLTLTYAIKTFNQNHCQDPRDKVYGLMGLVGDEDQLQIDYGKSLEELLLDVMTIFHANYKRKRPERTRSEFHEILVDLGKTWGIMSASLDAFLYDTWIKSTHDWLHGFGSEGGDYPYVRAMGFLPNSLDQSLKLNRKELLPYSKIPGRDPANLEPTEWIPTKDCWWYEVKGITYEIYGLISSTSLSGENATPGYYGKRVRQALKQ